MVVEWVGACRLFADLSPCGVTVVVKGSTVESVDICSLCSIFVWILVEQCRMSTKPSSNREVLSAAQARTIQ